MIELEDMIIYNNEVHRFLSRSHVEDFIEQNNLKPLRKRDPLTKKLETLIEYRVECIEYKNDRRYYALVKEMQGQCFLWCGKYWEIQENVKI